LDDRSIELFHEKEPRSKTMTGLACATKDAWAARHKITSNPVDNDWYAQLDGFESLVVSMPEDNAAKKETVLLFNSTVAHAIKGRESKLFREMQRDLYVKMCNYYDDKEQLAQIDEDLKILNKLYNEKEYENAIAKLQATQEARTKLLKEKGEKKAAAVAAKLEAKAAASSSSGEPSSKKRK